MIDPAKNPLGIRGLAHDTEKNVKESAQHFRDSLATHRPWIPNFSKNRPKPLTDLLGKGREFTWDQICEDAVKKAHWPGKPLSLFIVPPDPDRTILSCMSMPSQFAKTGGSVCTSRIWSETGPSRKPPLLPTHWIPLTNVQQGPSQNYPIYDRENFWPLFEGLRNWRHLMRNTTQPRHGDH